MKAETIEKMQKLAELKAHIGDVAGSLVKFQAEADMLTRELREGEDAAEVKAIFGIRERKPRKAKAEGSTPAPAKKRGAKTDGAS